MSTNNLLKITAIIRLYSLIIAADEKVEDNEISMLVTKIKEWAPEIGENQIKALLIYQFQNKINEKGVLKTTLIELAKYFKKDQLAEMVKDLIDLSLADNEIQKNEYEVIEAIIKFWGLNFDIKEYIENNYETQGEENQEDDDNTEINLSIIRLYCYIFNIYRGADERKLEIVIEKSNQWFFGMPLDGLKSLVEKVLSEISISIIQGDMTIINNLPIILANNLNKQELDEILKDLLDIATSFNNYPNQQYKSIEDLRKMWGLQYDIEEYLASKFLDNNTEENDAIVKDEEYGLPVLTVKKEDKGLTKQTLTNYTNSWIYPSKKYNNFISITALIPSWIEKINNDNVCPHWTKKDFENINKLITKNKIIPILGYLENLSLGNLVSELKNIWWFVPLAVLAEKVVSWVAVNKDGIYASISEPGSVDIVFSWDSISEINFLPLSDGFENDNNINTLLLSQKNGGYLTIHEFNPYDKEFGSYLSVINSIYQIRKKTIEKSSGKSIWVEGAGGEQFQLINKPQDLLKLNLNENYRTSKINKNQEIDTNQEETDYKNNTAIEKFRDFLISQFPTLKKVKSRTCVHRLKLGMELVAVCGDEGVQLFFVSNAKIEPNELLKLLSKLGISKIKINNKYSLMPFVGKRNSEYVRIEFKVLFEGRGLDSKEFRAEIKDIFGQFLNICEKLENNI